jgi:hypothetical protein
MAKKFKRKNPVYTSDLSGHKVEGWMFDGNSEEERQKALEEKIRKKLALKKH